MVEGQLVATEQASLLEGSVLLNLLEGSEQQLVGLEQREGFKLLAIILQLQKRLALLRPNHLHLQIRVRTKSLLPFLHFCHRRNMLQQLYA